MMIGGRLLETLPSASEARRYAYESLAVLPAPCHSLFQAHAWEVELSEQLEELNTSVRETIGS